MVPKVVQMVLNEAFTKILGGLSAPLLEKTASQNRAATGTEKGLEPSKKSALFAPATFAVSTRIDAGFCSAARSRFHGCEDCRPLH